jgi:hypothetical protein
MSESANLLVKVRRRKLRSGEDPATPRPFTLQVLGRVTKRADFHRLSDFQVSRPILPALFSSSRAENSARPRVAFDPAGSELFRPAGIVVSQVASPGNPPHAWGSPAFISRVRNCLRSALRLPTDTKRLVIRCPPTPPAPAPRGRRQLHVVILAANLALRRADAPENGRAEAMTAVSLALRLHGKMVAGEAGLVGLLEEAGICSVDLATAVLAMPSGGQRGAIGETGEASATDQPRRVPMEPIPATYAMHNYPRAYKYKVTTSSTTG